MALDTFNPYLFVSSGEQSNKFLTPTYAGGFANFQAQRAQELKGLTVQFGPIQEGTGDPSPENIRPISGRTGLTVTAAGKNILENTLTTRTVNGTTFTVNADGSITVSGTPTALTRVAIKTGLIADGKSAVVFSSGTVPTGVRYFARRVYNGATTYPTTSPTSNWTVGSEYYDLYLEVNTTYGGTQFTTYPQLEIGASATAYEPYAGHTYPISWQTQAGTIYGGTLNVTTGVLTVDRAIVDMGDLTWYYSASLGGAPAFYTLAIDGAKPPVNSSTLANIACSVFKAVAANELYVGTTTTGIIAMNTQKSTQVRDFRYATAADFKAAVTGQQFVYELATPQTYQLDPEQVMTLAGFNQVYSDAGPVIDIKF